MDYSQYREGFERDGFVVIPNFLPAAVLAELTDNLDRYIRDVVPTLPDADAFYQDKARPETLKQMQHMECDPFFAGYRRNEHWAGMAADLLGEPANAQGPEWFNKPPGTTHQTPPHQDNYYFNLSPPRVLTAWLALDPVDQENGCLRYVRGSHLQGLRPHDQTNVLGFSQGITDYGAADESNEVIVELQRGDLAVHHGETIHRAEPNQPTDRSRRAFAMVWRGESCCLMRR